MLTENSGIDSPMGKPDEHPVAYVYRTVDLFDSC